MREEIMMEEILFSEEALIEYCVISYGSQTLQVQSGLNTLFEMLW